MREIQHTPTNPATKTRILAERARMRAAVHHRACPELLTPRRSDEMMRAERSHSKTNTTNNSDAASGLTLLLTVSGMQLAGPDHPGYGKEPDVSPVLRKGNHAQHEGVAELPKWANGELAATDGAKCRRLQRCRGAAPADARCQGGRREKRERTSTRVCGPLDG